MLAVENLQFERVKKLKEADVAVEILFVKDVETAVKMEVLKGVGDSA